MQSDILRFTDAPLTDDGIERYEWHEYKPVARTSLNSAGEIRINIELQDLYSHPAESYLLFEGRLTRANGEAYSNADVVALTNNGLMHLFSQISYYLANQDIETIFHPGQATTMLGLLKYPDDFAKAHGLNQLWTKDTTATASIAQNTGFAVRQAYLIRKPTAKGTFSFVVPLKHIFGFCEDYDKVVYGMKHTLSLVRKSDDDAIYRVAPAADAAADVGAAAVGKVNLEKISWCMPQVFPSDFEKMELYKTIKAKPSLPVAYRAPSCDTMTVPQSTSFGWRPTLKTLPEKPRYIIVGFQTNKSGSQVANPSIFDHCSLKNRYVLMNQNRYPEANYSLSFPNQQFSGAYRDAATFSEKFYGMNVLVIQSNITPADYKELFPLFVFDVSKQSERLKTSVVNIQVKDFFNAPPSAGTDAYVVVISHKLLP